MPSVCVAYNCSSNSEKNPELMFHRFPDPTKDNERRKKWEYALKRENYTPGRTAKLCCLHFKETDYDPPVKITAPKRLKKDAIPSVFNFPQYLLPKKIAKRRQMLRVIPDEVQEKNDDITPPLVIDPPSFKDVAVQTTLTGIELTETIFYLRQEKKGLQKKVARLSKRVNSYAEMIKSL